MSTNVLKTAVVGKNFVGKSSLCKAIAGRTINSEYTSTIGVDYIVKHIEDTPIGFWDLAGLERFNSITTSYIKSSSIIIFCYSATDYDTYTEMIKKYNFYKDLKYLKNKRILIVVTKIDSENVKSDYEKWPEYFLKETGYPFVKTSSYKKIGLKEVVNTCLGKDNHNINTENITENTLLIKPSQFIEPIYKNYYSVYESFRCCIL